MSVRFKYAALCLLWVVQSSVLHAQYEASHWAFGTYAGLDFTCANTRLAISPFFGLEGGSTMSTADGKLLFITNGDQVWNKDFRIMPNGSDLGAQCLGFGDNPSSTQSALIVPHPGNPNQYYIFSTDCAEDYFADGLRYSIVDMSLNNGLGDVILKKQYLRSPVAEKIAAVFQPNGKDVWLVAHGIQNNEFYTYSITAGIGFNPVPIVSATGQIHTGGRGYLKFSPNGERLVANSFEIGYYNTDGIYPELFKFNKNTGKVTSDFVITSSLRGMYGASFSPNSSVLYLACAWGCVEQNIVQYDLSLGTPDQIMAHRQSMSVWAEVGALQLGIDGRLYFQLYNGDGGLGVFTNPNGIGAAADMIRDYIKYPCPIAQGYGLPNYIESYFQTPLVRTGTCPQLPVSFFKSVDFTSKSVCENLTVDFAIQADYIQFDHAHGDYFAWGGTPSYAWDFENQGYYVNPGTDPITHDYPAPGKYTVTLRAFDYYCFGTTVQKDVGVSILEANFSYTVACVGHAVNFKNESLACADGTTWAWDFGDPGPGNTSTLSDPVHVYPRAGTYEVTLTANGTSEKKINVEVLEDLPVLQEDVDFCFATPVTFGPVSDIPGATYQWDDGSTHRQLTAADPGQYSLVIVRNQCLAESKFNLHYRDCAQCDGLLKSISLGSDTVICDGDSFSMGLPETTPGTFAWRNGATTPKIQVDKAGTYTLKLTQGNCVTSASRAVEVKNCETCNDFITNIITPNGDGKNDAFVFSSDCDYDQFRMHIVNRWGKTIYTTSTPSWNGITGTDTNASGIYYYSIEYSHPGAQGRKIAEHRKGWIHVVK
ncbi:gliding motility-associated C-terminal domain-containing protein [Chryseolinea serpens]|uniref:Gliding motility-associated C-terminal domain-containing protein n=1 Tax=Chryseolinea serpens TaxID=947013 RepID=A0A1M5VDP4_9BACT|nr:PKD domain-containing protein [Chryseolinea serpens]SHH73301.1 gliding motility-associated C-terminal domain-containing protein [Chryseolinea serpens]